MDSDLRPAVLAPAAVNGARGISWAGLAAGPGAWAASTQADYAFAEAQCLMGVHVLPVLSVLLALVALWGTWLSLRAYNTISAEPDTGLRKPRTEVFLSLIAVGTGVWFALGILLQAFAGVVFIGCER